MKSLPALVALYNDLDAHLEAERAAGEQTNDTARMERAQSKQRLNDQAYFLICWGQIEVAVDECCRQAIRKRRAATSWSVRRGWDLYNPEDRRLSGLSFEDRVALVLDKQGGKGSNWSRLLSYYAIRNQIAHGALRSDRIDVASAAADFHVIGGSLTN